MYSLLTFLTLLATYLLLRALKEDRFKYWLGFAISTILAIYTHYYAFFILLAQNLFFFFSERKWTKKWLLIQAIILLAYIPWISTIEKLASSEGQIFRRHLFPLIPYSFFRFALGYSLIITTPEAKIDLFQTLKDNLSLIIVTSLIFGPLFLGGIKKSWSEKRSFLLLNLLLFLPMMVGVLISLKVPMLSERYLIVSSPFFYIFLALGIVNLKGKKFKILGLAGLLLLLVIALHSFYFNPKFGKEQWREATDYVEENSEPGDIVFFDPNYINSSFNYYYQGNLERYSLYFDPSYSQEETFSHLAPILERHSRAWLIQSHNSLSGSFYKDLFQSRFHLIEAKRFPLGEGIRVSLFQLSP